MITSIFSDSNEVEAVGHLSGSNAQTFIDTIYEVISHTTSFSDAKGKVIDQIVHISSIRC